MLPNYLWVILIRTRTCIFHGKNFNLKWIINQYSCRKVISSKHFVYSQICHIIKDVVYITAQCSNYMQSALYTKNVHYFNNKKLVLLYVGENVLSFRFFLVRYLENLWKPFIKTSCWNHQCFVMRCILVQTSTKGRVNDKKDKGFTDLELKQIMMSTS